METAGTIGFLWKRQVTFPKKEWGTRVVSRTIFGKGEVEGHSRRKVDKSRTVETKKNYCWSF